jgi:hypothetical protein
MLEAARTSETSVDIQLRTRLYIQQDSELHTGRRENLKSHTNSLFLDIFIIYIPQLSAFRAGSTSRKLSCETDKTIYWHAEAEIPYRI